MNRTTAIIIQARVGSTRLSRKVLKEIAGKPMLWHVIQRALKCHSTKQIIVATTQLDEDQSIEQIARACGVACFRGDERDLLSRFYEAAEQWGAEIIVRMTADCPLIHPETVDRMVKHCLNTQVDYVTLNHHLPLFEVGVEVLTFSALATMHQRVENAQQKEHLTLYIREHPDRFKVGLIDPDPLFQRGDLRLAVDEQPDLDFIREIYKRLYKEGSIVDLREVVALIDQYPSLKEINAKVQDSAVNRYIRSEEMKKKLNP